MEIAMIGEGEHLHDKAASSKLDRAKEAVQTASQTVRETTQSVADAVERGRRPARAQAYALDIEAQAKRRLADEYDAAQALGEGQRRGLSENAEIPSEEFKPTAADIGLDQKVIQEGRQIRDADARSPGVVRPDGREGTISAPLDQLAHWTREAPLQALAIAFLSGAMLGRRRS